MNGIKCGKCKERHADKYEVRACYGLNGTSGSGKAEEKLMKEVREAKPTSLEYEADELFI